MLSISGLDYDLLADKIREAAVNSSDSGVVSVSTGNTLTDTTKNWDINQWASYIVLIITGTGIGQARKILSNTTTQLTVDVAWIINPDTTSSYAIILVGVGTITGTVSITSPLDGSGNLKTDIGQGGTYAKDASLTAIDTDVKTVDTDIKAVEPRQIVDGTITTQKLAVDASGRVTIASISGALPAGTNVIGHVIIDSGTITVSGSVGITGALPSGTNVIGHVINDASTAVIGHVIIDSGSVTVASGTITLGVGSALAGIVEIADSAGTNKLAVDSSGRISILAITNALPSGTNVIGHVINDSGTITTVSAVTAITNALPAGTNVIGHVIVDSGTITTVSTVTAVTAITNALPAGTNVLGHIIVDSGTITTVSTLSAITRITLANTALPTTQTSGTPGTLTTIAGSTTLCKHFQVQYPKAGTGVLSVYNGNAAGRKIAELNPQQTFFFDSGTAEQTDLNLWYVSSTIATDTYNGGYEA